MSIWETLFPNQDYRTPAPSGGYADLYANGLLGNRADTPSSVNAMQSGVDFIPGVGDAIAAKDAYDAYSRGDKAAAGLLATGAALGLIPGAGDAVARPIMAAGRKMADVAGRIEVDPTAIGSLLGNVRMKPAGEAKQSVAEMRRQANIDRFGYDPNEAPAAKPSVGLLSDYAGEHHAPMRDGNAPAFNLAGDIYPDDIYSSNAVQYYGTGNESMDKDTMGLLQSLRGQPDADVKIYRAVPKGVDDLNAGDWVTVNKQYAQDHGEAALGGDFDIVERKVKASEIFTNGDSIHEFGYDPLPPAPSLPTPRNEAEAMAQKVLEMRAAGNAGDVTEDMMALADDTYMYNNTPLPMDEASRAARGRDTGRNIDLPLYHGGSRDFSGFNPSVRGKIGPGVYLTPDVKKANRFAGYEYGPTERIEKILNQDNLRQSVVYPVVATDAPAPMDVRMQARKERSAYDDNIDAYRKVFGEGGYDGVRVEDERTILDPTNVRSRFARFDPEFKHLRNLSAGVGGVGLLNAMMEEEQRQQQGLLQ
jgi:hypothetical protein